jgi:hypothetical protein
MHYYLKDLFPTIEFSFSEILKGVIWKTLADPGNNRLLIEVRDNELKLVSFSILDLENRVWILKDISFDEPWWVSLAGVSGNVTLFTMYTDTNNPDKKSVFAYHIDQQKILWWKNNFAFTALNDNRVFGIESKFGSKEVILDLTSGNEVTDRPVLPEEQNFIVIRPFQYHEGNPHFDTVRSFIEMKCHFLPVISIEYCEYNSLILVSLFVRQTDLANYLIVFSPEGDILLKETLGEQLKGIALDTFFIFSGYLIFVKNKRELVSYKIV